ncbi:hypothetical protein E3A20_03860 [Planctomyces bekefii]|uniref:TVP38/TMEM64 family membrane protein n=1 Tax=Planctomyces bekefii TaxID=1653850 RepID=A0A5C6MBP7_9PLAN|nr:hypothetical protein E3A20_03860 [Planctomyces bekefii]
MKVYSYSKQVKAVVATQVAIFAGAFAIATIFWTHLCDATLESCLADGGFAKPFTFLLLSVIRPFVFTPLLFVAIIGGKAFGTFGGTLLTALGSVFSGLAVFGLTNLLGKKLAKPWLRSNLPATFKFIRSQDYKLVFAARLIPLLPFDLVSFIFGALDFRVRSVAIATFFGALPEAYLFAKLVDPSETLLSSTLWTLFIFGVCVLLPLIFFEFLSRKKGTGMWQLMKAMYNEINYEVQKNNDIVKRAAFSPDKTPVVLLYGFFSSRRAMTVLERMLTARGHQVLSFNLGGLMGTFFTRDILETANFIDYKIKRQIERHGFKKVNIVAHSKGGMVGLWWALKLGGHKYCDKVVTMGTPFCGSRFTYLALLTPLGLIWRDVGQMRPGSRFLKSLHDVEVPDGCTVYCMHSERDGVARGIAGIFRPKHGKERVKAVAMDHISHFEFLYRRDVGDKIHAILSSDGENVSSETNEGASPDALAPANSKGDAPEGPAALPKRA